MGKLKTFLAISIPIAIVIVIWGFLGGNSTIAGIALIYALFAGIFWKFAKHL